MVLVLLVPLKLLVEAAHNNIKEKDESIQCDKCGHWILQKRTDISAELMKYLGTVKGIRWFCDSCVNPVKSILSEQNKITDQIDSVMGSIKEMQKKIQDMKAENTAF